MKEYVEANDKLRYIDVFTPMLTQEGRPRPDLFLQDGLHPNARGYAVWTAIIRPILEQYQHDRAPAEPTVKKKPQAPNSKPQCNSKSQASFPPQRKNLLLMRTPRQTEAV